MCSRLYTFSSRIHLKVKSVFSAAIFQWHSRQAVLYTFCFSELSYNLERRGPAAILLNMSPLPKHKFMAIFVVVVVVTLTRLYGTVAPSFLMFFAFIETSIR